MIKEPYKIVADTDPIKFEVKCNALLQLGYNMLQQNALIAKGAKDQLTYIREFHFIEESKVARIS